jgi:hypothetical protein
MATDFFELRLTGERLADLKMGDGPGELGIAIGV